MTDSSDMISIVGLQVPALVYPVLLGLSAFLGYLIDQRLAGWIYPIRLITGMGAMLLFGILLSMGIYGMQVQRFGVPVGWSSIGFTMVVAEGTGQISGGGFITIFVIRIVRPAILLAHRTWDWIAPYLRVRSQD